MSDPFLGQITIFAGNFAPQGWAFCSGQLLQISSFSALFSLLGTNYGGDGETTFGLPDLRGRVPRGSEGNSAGPGLVPVPLGQKSGTVEQTLTITQLPSHNHPLGNNAHSGSANETAPGGNALAETADDVYSSSTANVRSGPAATQNNTGATQPFNILNPYLGLNYIIALTGTFPSQN